MKILVGSENPVKIEAVREAFSEFFEEVEVLGFKVKSGVPPQPLGEETFRGAENRAKAVMEIDSERKLYADFFVGIEGGIVRIIGKWFAFGGICIMDRKGKTSFGTSPLFQIPDTIATVLVRGFEVGHVMDRITGEKDSKRKGGAIGYFTKGIMERKDLYKSGIIAAFVPFLNQDLFY